MTKIDIFSGFLGAGKTTLIKKLLKEAYADEKVVLIENEFGEIGIDGGFLREAGVEITEMNSGCICCSLVGDFGKALVEVLERFAPDRILIEPSGVGKLSDVCRAVGDVLGEDVVLGSAIAVADATKCRVYMKNFGEFYNDQIQHANAIVLSRTGGMSEDKLAAAVALLREKNAEAVIVTTPWEELDGKDLLAAVENKRTVEAELAELMQEHEHHHHHDHKCECGHEHHPHHDHECECGHEHHHHHDRECERGHGHHHHHDHECECRHEHHHHHDHECECGHEHHHHDHECECGHEHHHHHDHHADEVFSSIGRETAKTYTEETLRSILAAFDRGEAGEVLRAKGILRGEDGKWLHFNYVPEEMDIRVGGADVIGRLCVIGAHLDEDKIASLFGLQ